MANEAEGDELSCELAKLWVAAVGREDREVAMTGQLSSLQEEVATVAKEKACLQVENRTLQSQSSSLLAQINSLQVSLASDWSTLSILSSHWLVIMLASDWSMLLKLSSPWSYRLTTTSLRRSPPRLQSQRRR